MANSLNATKYLSEPCSALSASQLQGLRLPTSGKPDTTSAIAKNAGPGCRWSNVDTGDSVNVTFMTGNKNGLADFYRAHEEQGRFQGYWVETTVDGYPAVFEDDNDTRNQGLCDLAVGISDTLTFRVNKQVPASEDRTQSCDRAKQVASLVIKTLQAGG